MTIEKFLKELNIDKEIKYEKEKAVITLDDSNEYAKLYTLLTESDMLDLESEEVVVNQKIVSLKFLRYDYEVILSADLERDIYRITIEEII